MSHEVKIHDAQVGILRELLFHPEAGFSELQKPTGLNSDHFKFHIGRLVELGYIDKVTSGKYRLSIKGKEYANKLDTDANTIERQPKVSIILILTRKNKNGDTEHLFQQRLKNPYFGYWARLGGKLKWGESVIEGADRELEEETGLRADFTFRMLYHKRDYKQNTKDLLEDKLFIIMVAENPAGDLIERFEGGYNKWMTPEEFLTTEKRFESAYEFIELLESGIPFVEKEFYYDESEY